MEKIKILVVDDDHATRDMYVEVFKNAGMSVIEAGDGVEGLDIATKDLPDVIFTGIIMPRMDGFAMIEALKKNVSTCNIPIVVSSHLGKENDRQRANVLGVKDFIVRDVTPPKQVIERIKTLFVAGDFLIDFNPYNLDAQKLARELGVSNNFQCLECSERMVLKIKLVNPKERTFEAQFVCPKCGWEAR